MLGVMDLCAKERYNMLQKKGKEMKRNVTNCRYLYPMLVKVKYRSLIIISDQIDDT